MDDKSKSKGEYTLSEIKSQADSWEGVFKCIDGELENIKHVWLDIEEVVIAGCGSGFNIANSVAPFFQKVTGVTCRAVHASDILINRQSFLNKNRKTLVVVYSRSGDTTESHLAMKTAKNAGAATIAIVCFRDSGMAGDADIALVLEDAVEKSVTTTRSFTSMVLAGYYLAAKCGDDDDLSGGLMKLPTIARGKMTSFRELGERIAADEKIKKYAFLGSGSCYGLAREAQLKVKEMVLLPSDSYVSLDYQHGPMSNVDENMLVTIMISDAGSRYDRELAENMRKLGGRTFILGDGCDDALKKNADYLLELGTGLEDGLRDVLYMPVLQFMAYYKSLAVGCDPDNPKNLSYHVTLK